MSKGQPPLPMNPDVAPSGTRLDSWKEIGAYLKRDIRTVQRWEKQEGLPVHRHLHDERGTAYAFSSEIDEWLKKRRSVEDDQARRPKRSTLFIVVAATLGAIGAIAAAVVWIVTRARPEVAPLSSLAVVFGPSETVPEWGPDIALSPDGSTIVYIAKAGPGPWHLHVRRLDQLEGRPLQGTANGVMPFFSPDGRWIGFLAIMPAKLMKISLDGGPPVPLADVAFQGAADWSSAGEIVYANMTSDGRHGLFRVSASGGTPRLVAVLDRDAGETYWLTPQWIPESQAILSTVVVASPRGSHYQLVAVSTATGKRHVVLDDAKHGHYVGDGILVYQREGSLFASRIDTTRLELTGPPIGVWDGVFPSRVRGRSWAHAGGMLVYAPSLRTEHRLAWVYRTGKVEELSARPDFYLGPRLAPDGQSVAVVIGGEFGNVWRYDLATNALVQLTFDGRSTAAIWTPDGSHLTVSTMRNAGGEIVQLRADGSGQPDLLTTSPVTKYPSSWARDKGTLVFGQHAVAGEHEIWAVTPNSTLETKPVVQDAGSQWGAQISPDGRWMAYSSSESGRNEVYVTAFPAARPKWRVSTDGGIEPVWARSGRELFYLSGDRMMSVSVTPGSTFAPGAPRLLFKGRFYVRRPGDPNYDVSLDDQRFLMVLPGDNEGADRLNVIQGWTKTVEQRLRDGT